MKKESSTIIPIYSPYRAKNQKKYVLDCVDSNWISSRGSYVDKFEEMISEIVGVKHTIATFNGSVSLTLILHSLGIGREDEVIVPSLTYAATISSINLIGAKAVLVDSDSNFQMSLEKLDASLSKSTKAIMLPQLYGDAPDMEKLHIFCKKNKLHLIEDSAEAFGCKYGTLPIGSMGIASSFSFFANKTITTGEGGCVCTNDTSLAKKMRLLKSQSHIGNFIHNGPGFNFRMTNIQAAIGVAQLEDFNVILSKKKRIAAYYRKHLPAEVGRIIPKIDSAEWMPLFTLPSTINYAKFQALMSNQGIETRPAFCPIHLMEGFNIETKVSLTNSEKIYKAGFNLPCYPDLTQKDLSRVVNCVEISLNDFK